MTTIRVSFAELRTTGHYSNMRAEASIEMESQDPEQDFPELWARVRKEVREQLDAEERQRREQQARDLRAFLAEDDPDDEDQDGDDDEREDLEGYGVPDEVFVPPDYQGPKDDSSEEDESL